VPGNRAVCGRRCFHLSSPFDYSLPASGGRLPAAYPPGRIFLTLEALRWASLHCVERDRFDAKFLCFGGVEIDVSDCG